MKYIIPFITLLPSLMGHNIVKRQEGGPPPQPQSREIAQDIYSFTTNGQYISMFIITNDGVIVLEPMNRKHSEAMLTEIRKFSNAPIKYLIYSHNHWDHASGGQVFKDEGATIVSHKDAFDYQKANPNPEVVLADMKWTGDQFDIKLGGTTVELHHMGLSHGTGMTTFVIPEKKVGFIADVAVPDRAYFTYLPDFNIPGLLKTLKAYSRFDVDTIVFTHNGNEDRLSTGTQEDIRFAIKYIEDIQDGVRAELQKGGSPFAIPQTLKLPQYENLAMYEQWFPLNVQAVLFDILLGPIGWRPENGGDNPCTAPRTTSSSAPSFPSTSSSSFPSTSSSSSSSFPSKSSSSSTSYQQPLPTYSSSSSSTSYQQPNYYKNFQSKINNFKSLWNTNGSWRPVKKYRN